jgi:TPR repeat protein
MPMRWPRLLLSRTGLAGVALLALGAVAHAEHEFAPENAIQTIDAIGLRCNFSFTCPIDYTAFQALVKAAAGDRDAQYRLAEILDFGRGVVRDENAAVAWFGKAAEQGLAKAALSLNAKRHAGAAIDADEAKIAAALKPEADNGDTEAMRALADMTIYGRGVQRSAEGAVQLLRRAADNGSTDAEADLADLFLIGAPGIAVQPAESIHWRVAAGRHGDLESMFVAGAFYLHAQDSTQRDPAEGYRWLMRASLLDYPRAQEMLSGILADGVMVGARTVIAPDPVHADMWLRLAARSPFFDNSSIRYHIETPMNSTQLNEAKKLAAEWRPVTLKEALAMPVDPPPVSSDTARPWPPGLMGNALDLFKQAGDNPEPWQRLPDFAKTDAVMAAVTAIAAHCEQQGQKDCADFCRRRLDEIAPPLRPGGLPVEEMAKYLAQHPDKSPVTSMRKEPATPDEAMRSWVICANRVGDRP